MVTITVSAFSGESPLVIPSLLPETGATEVYNARLNDGGLTPINKAVATGYYCPDGTKTIYRDGSTWLYWNKHVNVVPAPVAADRLYLTGDGKPKVIIGAAQLNLAVPRPTGSPVATVSGSGTGDTVTRAYVYTFVTEYGEESAPSPATPIVDWLPGKTVVLSGIEAPASGRGVTKQRFYRSQTGSSGTYLYFIAERAASSSNFTDTVAVDAFQEAIPSVGWDEPPDNLSGLISMPNGMMAAYSGKEVLFSEPWHPHAWPQKYSMLCDAPIVALAAIGEVLVVLTTGQPYIMTGTHPDSIQSVKLETNQPCINAKGVVDLGYCIAYPSNEGLIAIAADGAVKNLTETLFSDKEWHKLKPREILGAQVHGAYALFYDVVEGNNRKAGCLFVYPGGTPFIIRSSEIAVACRFEISDSSLYFTRDGDTNIYQFDPPTGYPETLFWKSKEWWLPRPMNLGVFGATKLTIDQPDIYNASEQVIADIDAANIALFASPDFPRPLNSHMLNGMALNDDSLLDYPHTNKFQAVVLGDGQVVGTIDKVGVVSRLAAKNQYQTYQVAISTNVPISKFKLCSTMDEYRSTP